MDPPDAPDGTRGRRRAGRQRPPSRSPRRRRASRAGQPKAERQRIGSCGARGETEQSFVARLAQVRDRVVADVDVADAAARERGARGAARPGARYASRSSASHASGPSHGIVRRASSPHSPSRPSSSPANIIGTPGVVICRPTPTSCRSRVPTTVRKRAVSWLSSSFHECSVDARARRRGTARMRRRRLRPVEARAAGRSPEMSALLGQRRRAATPHRAQEAGVVHDAVPAAPRGRGGSRGRARRRAARPRGSRSRARSARHRG